MIMMMIRRDNFQLNPNLPGIMIDTEQNENVAINMGSLQRRRRWMLRCTATSRNDEHSSLIGDSLIDLLLRRRHPLPTNNTIDIVNVVDIQRHDYLTHRGGSCSCRTDSELRRECGTNEGTLEIGQHTELFNCN